MKKIIILNTLIALLYSNNSFGMLRAIKKTSFCSSKALYQKRQFIISLKEISHCIQTMEISNQNIIKTLCDNEERPLNEHTLRLQRIRRFYGENIIACNNINIESFKKGGIIDIVIPERDVLVFQQIEKLIRSKE